MKTKETGDYLYSNLNDQIPMDHVNYEEEKKDSQIGKVVH